MIQARFFIGDESVEYSFDENDIYSAIDTLAMVYYEKMKCLPIAIFVSPDLYKIVTTQNMRHSAGINVGVLNMQFHTAVGVVMVKPVFEPKERFIYAGNQQGYENSLIDKRFEEVIFGVEG